MRFQLCALCVLIVVIILAGCGAPAESNALSGTVFKDEDGDGTYDADLDIAIPGATVGLYRDDVLVAEGTTDRVGRYFVRATAGAGYRLDVWLDASVRCYDPESGEWGNWNTIHGEERGIRVPGEGLDIGVAYRMLNYGPDDFLWELWHEGPIFGRDNVILVHGAQVSLIPLVVELGDGKVRGQPDYEFNQLHRLLQQREHGQTNVWEFEYADVRRLERYWTHGSIRDYGNRLGLALNAVRELSDERVSVVSHSMGGLVSRYAAQYASEVGRVMTLATGHFGFEYAVLGAGLTDIPSVGEMMAGSDMLWDLNRDFRHGDFELASIAAAEDEPGFYPPGGVVRYSSASAVECQADGSVTYDPGETYFTIVPGTHDSIKDFDLSPEDDSRDDDFVFEGIKAFLRSGVSEQLTNWSDFVYPEDTGSRPLFTFRLAEQAPEGYPGVRIGDRLVSSLSMYSTEGERITWTVSAGAGEAGIVSVEYDEGEYAYGWLTRGQSAVMTAVVDN